jgi:PAS domain S-box-containing protein
MNSLRHGAVLATWAIILLVLAMVISVGLYTRTTLRSVQQTLPTTLLDQLEDLSRITEGVWGLVNSADLTRRDPTPVSINALMQDIETVYAELVALRNTYVFDNLVQASAFHSAVAPALVDAKQWLTHGLSGHPPDAPLILNIVHSRLQETLLKASAVRYASHDTAQAVLMEQRERLERFLAGVNLLLLLTLLISAIVLGLMLRQHRLLRSEARAKAERERLTAIVEITNDLVSTSTLDGRLMYLNSSGRRLAGWEDDEDIAGKQIQDLHPKWALDLIQNTGIPAALSDGVWSGETAVVHSNGIEIPVSQHIMAHKDVDDRPQYLSTIMRDISERKQVEQEREKMQAQLLQAQKMESVGILAGGVAHDFNNLLHAMRGHIELLLQSKSEDHPDARRLQNVTRSMDRAAQLVQQLLFFSRKSASRRVRINLNKEAQEAFQILERTIPKMIALEQHLDPGIWPIFADPVQIEQILLNLASNAVDAMPDGGRLMVETSNVVLDEAFMRLHPGAFAGPHVLLTVTDTGSGMDKEVLDHVFDPFFTTKEVGRGTGLGLASVYGIVKAHGGHIQCYSQPGEGTTFRVYWPVVRGDEEMIEKSSQETLPPESGNETILVVDDDAQIRELTQEALEALGYSARMAASGEQALKIFQEQGASIDLVLLDLNMPGMGGYRCLEELLRLDPNVKVVIASGYTVNGHGENAVSSGAKGFIGKPYQLKELAAMVRKVVDEK